ncbi:hypothetical protein GLOTRDRAFT_131215 [Gloeophyllum trabeum ATCC 11539]|uniref:Uncharacterized protein n=1 Tax=Gloeophyllum trabeum (strain ATCC 11539 / FP-39264 / Madison 617) TaxID=670483 RepID=S7RFF0_GLOTA|nr:uncharacterized protein GLOTRDRAFT_131215 [Gloeophyllum trabeum ATCC 11539]EPQ52925.1 hypothetical protein GLOTRDRAFT_131215 [Gloeophyllum trabeum ATCC 11539]
MSSTIFGDSATGLMGSSDVQPSLMGTGPLELDEEPDSEYEAEPPSTSRIARDKFTLPKIGGVELEAYIDLTSEFLQDVLSDVAVNPRPVASINAGKAAHRADISTSEEVVSWDTW